MEKLKTFLKRIKINLVLAIVMSFVLVRFVSEEVFVANTPNINPEFVAKLQNMPQTIANIPAMFSNKDESEAVFSKVQKVTPPDNLQFQPLTSKVEAAEDPMTGKSYIKFENGAEFKIEEHTINGEKRTFLVPVR